MIFTLPREKRVASHLCFPSGETGSEEWRIGRILPALITGKTLFRGGFSLNPLPQNGRERLLSFPLRSNRKRYEGRKIKNRVSGRGNPLK
jgi:hypothetical protein